MLRNSSRRFSALTLLAGLATLLVLGGFGCTLFPNAQVAQKTKPITLKFWSVYDDADSFGDAFTAYQAIHHNVSFDFKRLTYDEYEKQILNALAEDQGPDIVSLPATWMHRFQPELMPVPQTLTLAYREIQGTIQKQAVTVIHSNPGITLKQLANDYVDVVSQDAVMLTAQADPKMPLIPKIYGLPLSVDTMALYYNKDLLNRAGIAQPAGDWKTFQDQVKKITKLDQTGTIIQSGVALGTADNVERGTDVLSLLMMQNGANMTDDSGTVTFDRYPPELAGRPFPPGAEALIFYTDFANPVKEVYTWNDKMPNSLQAFENGQTAFFFGYSYHMAQIRLANPKLNFGVSSFPQIEGNKPIYYPNYWINAVTSKTQNPNEAWDFVEFMAKPENVKSYLAKTHQPAALRSLVNDQLQDLDLNVFASQESAAKSWYHGTDAVATEQAFQDMIRQMLAGNADPTKILELGASKVNQTIK